MEKIFFFFFSLDNFISFCLIVLTGTSSTMWIKIGNRGDAYVIPDLRGTLSLILTMGFSYIISIILRNVPSKSSFES